jgi:hypothetical protein
MKTIILTLSIICSQLLIAQDVIDKKTIAVANPNVSSLKIPQEGAAKMMRLELIKLNTYHVFDEFDMKEIIQTNENFSDNCFGQNCLINLGESLKTDLVMCGSLDLLGGKIVVSLKIIDVQNKKLWKSTVHEFDNQEMELQRMIEIVIKEIHDQPIDKTINERLAFKHEIITSNNIGKINNSGPRIGGAAMTGNIREYAVRPESQGGMNVMPYVSMIGYQIEGQYVGTENFSALVEGIVNVSGLEQGQFIPSFTFMNGFRFGKGNWEFAFGPGFGIKKMSYGFFDNQNLFSENQRYFNRNDWNDYAMEHFSEDPQYNVNGYFEEPSPEQASSNAEGYNFNSTHFDSRGILYLNTSFVFAVGKTFKAGALNIPVNLFYSSQKGGGFLGFNIGFNVLQNKNNINE